MNKPRKEKGSLFWRLLGALIIVISLFLGFYLKILFVTESRERRERLENPPTQEMQHEADVLNRVLEGGR